MKIPNKQELQQITFNRSSDIDCQDFMNLYKKCTAKPYSILVIDTTVAYDNPSRFRKCYHLWNVQFQVVGLEIIHFGHV